MLCQFISRITPNITDLASCILNTTFRVLSSCCPMVAGRWMESKMMLISESRSIEICFLQHTSSIRLRYGSRVDDRTGHWSRKWMVVSCSDLHSRQISSLLGLAVDEVARGYRCVRRRAFADVLLMSSLLLRSNQTGCIWCQQCMQRCRDASGLTSHGHRSWVCQSIGRWWLPPLDASIAASWAACWGHYMPMAACTCLGDILHGTLS